MTYKVICLHFCLQKTDKKCNCKFIYVLIILCYYKTYSIVLLWTTPITDTLWHLSELMVPSLSYLVYLGCLLKVK